VFIEQQPANVANQCRRSNDSRTLPLYNTMFRSALISGSHEPDTFHFRLSLIWRAALAGGIAYVLLQLASPPS
jgi:uncharacterized protein (DUF2236 family)